MSYIIKNQIRKISDFLSELSWIDAMLVMGSHAQNCLDVYSDIDLYLFGSEDSAWIEFTEDPEPLFNQIFSNLSFTNWIPSKSPDSAMNNKLWILYLPDEFIKIELHLYNGFNHAPEIENLRQFFIASRPSKLNKSIFFDKSGQLSQFLKSWMILDISLNPKDLIEEEIRKFINYYESFFPPFHRGDLYRAHLQHNLCYYKLANIIALVHNLKDRLYCPRNLMNKGLNSIPKSKDDTSIQKKKAIKILQQSTSTINPREMQQKLELMYSYIISVVQNLSSKVGISSSDLQKFHKKIHQKYPPFFKFRDFGRNSLGEPHIRKNFLYRSGYLSRYNPDYLIEVFKSYNIHSILDLRTNSEYDINPYNLELLNRKNPTLDYIQIPIEMKDDYSKTLISNSLQYRKILNIISSSMKPIVIHCVGGTDRTGLLFALLYWLCDLDHSKILEDYNLSVTGLRLFSMTDFLNFLNSKGKIQIFYNVLKMDPITFQELKQKLI